MGPEDKNAELAARLQLVERLGSIISWEFDMSENLLIVSNNLSDALGRIGVVRYDFDEIVSQTVFPDDLERLRQVIKDAFRTGRIGIQEFRLNLPSGQKKTVQINGRALIGKDGNTRLLGSMVDITRWREAEQDVKDKTSFLNALIENVSYPVYYKDNDLVFRYCNKAFYESLGIPRESVLGRLALDLIPNQDWEAIREKDRQLLLQKGSSVYQSKFSNSDGTQHDVLFNKSVVLDSGGNTKGLVGIITDISEDIKSQELLQRTTKMKDLVLTINNAVMEKSTLNDLFEYAVTETLKVMENADSGCITTLDENNILRIAACSGYPKDSAADFSIPLEETFQWLLTGGNIEKTQIINDLDTSFERSITDTILHNNSGIKTVSTISSPLILDGRLIGFIHMDSSRNNVFNDDDLYLMDYLRGQMVNAISKFRLYENMLYLSDHDPQTDLYNRRYLQTALESALEKGLRYKERFLIASFDIDKLKEINDSLGHLAGDELIRHFAGRLKSLCRHSDVVARTGGDEFIAIIYNAELDEIHEKFEAMKIWFGENPILFEGSSFTCGFSFGLSRFPEDGTTQDDLISRADLLLYADKFR